MPIIQAQIFPLLPDLALLTTPQCDLLVKAKTGTEKTTLSYPPVPVSPICVATHHSSPTDCHERRTKIQSRSIPQHHEDSVALRGADERGRRNLSPQRRQSCKRCTPTSDVELDKGVCCVPERCRHSSPRTSQRVVSIIQV